MPDVYAYATHDKMHRDDFEFICVQCFNDPKMPAARKWHFTTPITTRLIPKSPVCLNCGRKP